MKMTKKLLQSLAATGCEGPALVAELLPAHIDINPEKNLKLARKLVAAYAAQQRDAWGHRDLQTDLSYITWKHFGVYDNDNPEIDINAMPSYFFQDPYIVAQVLGWLADRPKRPRV